jgi:hypothetical protein
MNPDVTLLQSLQMPLKFRVHDYMYIVRAVFINNLYLSDSYTVHKATHRNSRVLVLIRHGN